MRHAGKCGVEGLLHARLAHHSMRTAPCAATMLTPCTLQHLNMHAGMPVIYPRNDLTYAENLLYMMHAVPCEPYKVLGEEEEEEEEQRDGSRGMGRR